MNFGVDSYGTAQELLTLRYLADKFSPDAVVLAVFTGNDIRNNSSVLEGDKCRPFFVLRSGELVPGGPFEDSSSYRLRCHLRFMSREFAVLNLIGSAQSVLKACPHRPSSPRATHSAHEARS